MLNNLAPLGIDWASIPMQGASESLNTAALLDLCFIATDAISDFCFQPLRATIDIEELLGPGGDRLVFPPVGNGNAMALMQHWPITAVLGAQVANAGQFPPSWQQIPLTSLRVSEPSSQLIGPSAVGASGSDGMNAIEIQGSYVNWGNGRMGYRIQLAYENGWPSAGIMPSATTTATLVQNTNSIAVESTTGIAVGAPIVCLDYIPDGTTVLGIDGDVITMSSEASLGGSVSVQVGYAAGVTALNIDDVTGMLDTAPTIFDGASSEAVIITGAQATTPVSILSGTVSVQVGPGVITLASPTRQPHIGSEPAQALISALPSNVRLAGYYYAADEALTRGATAIAVPALPGSMQGSGGTPGIGTFTTMAQNQLKNFRRVF